MSTIVNNNQTVDNTYSNKNLKLVDNLSDYQVHQDDTDIRGYKVKSITGEIIGEVEGLLADVPARLVRYAEIEVDDDVIERHTAGRYDAEDRNVLVPIGLVQINDDKTITLTGIGLNHMVDYPRYKRGTGYMTRYEIDTNNYLSDFHEYGTTYKRDVYDTDTYRTRTELDNAFYSSRYYTRS